MASTLEFRISNLGSRAASTRELFPFATLDGSDVVVRCPPGTGDSLSEKLVWLWGLLKHERRKLKSLQANGATLTCICTVSDKQLVLLPNAAEFLHLTGASLVINVGAA